FMFPGQGAQYAGMGQSLYQGSALFRDHIDNCFAALAKVSSINLRDVMFPPASGAQACTGSIDNTEYAQPAMFIIEYALARTWMELGIQPRAMIGHSVGEFVCACLAEVMPLDDALRLVAERGRM